MKPFLGINITTNKKNEEMNGEVFLVDKPSLALSQALEDSFEVAEETIEESKLSRPMRIVKWICGITALLITLGILNAFGEDDSISFAQAYQNASWIFWLGGGCLALWMIITIIGLHKEKTILENDESTQTFNNFDKTCQAVLSDLEVPTDSKEIDLLSFYYKIKNNDIKVCEKGLQLAPYINPIFHIFVDSENLYLANLEVKYAIKLSTIKSIKTINKTIRILEWNKDEPYNKGIYKQYKIAEDKYGCVFCKNYHILEFEHENELWGIYFPCYELPVFEKFTGLKAQTK